MKRPDVVALVFGLLLTTTALVSLWQSFVGVVDWNLMKIAAPLALVVIGVLGLALSRNRE